MLATGIPFAGKPGHGQFLKELHQVSQRVAGVRRFGSAALDLAYVAAGRFDGYWERDLKPWDTAAGEASDHRGGRADQQHRRRRVLAARGQRSWRRSSEVHALMLERIAAAG